MVRDYSAQVVQFCSALDTPAQAQRLRQAAREEERTVSELLREAIRLYMEEREWRVKERMQRRSRRSGKDEPETE